LSSVAAFVAIIAVGATVHFVAIGLYTAWWESSVPSQPIPQDALTFLNWAVPGGFALIAGKLVGDRV